MLPPITYGLMNQLDAYLLSARGWKDDQNLISAVIPDNVSSKGWLGSGYDLYYSLSAAPNGGPAFVFTQGNIKQENCDSFLPYNSMSVMIAATRTGNSSTGLWMGLYSMYYARATAGINILALTDNNYNYNFSGWGTFNYVTTQSTSAMNLNTPYIISMTGDANSSGTYYTNTTATGTFSTSKAQPYFGLGGYGPGGGFFVGEVYEVLVYNRSLSASEITTNANYLINKWF